MFLRASRAPTYSLIDAPTDSPTYSRLRSSARAHARTRAKRQGAAAGQETKLETRGEAAEISHELSRRHRFVCRLPALVAGVAQVEGVVWELTVLLARSDCQLVVLAPPVPLFFQRACTHAEGLCASVWGRETVVQSMLSTLCVPLGALLSLCRSRAKLKLTQR